MISLFAWAGSMLVYIDTASAVKSRAFFGRGLIAIIERRRSSESRVYVCTCLIANAWSCTSNHFERKDVTDPESLTTGLVFQEVLCIFGSM